MPLLGPRSWGLLKYDWKGEENPTSPHGAYAKATHMKVGEIRQTVLRRS